MRTVRGPILGVILALTASYAATAGAGPAAEPVARRVVVLWDSRGEVIPDVADPVHLQLEAPLNHLGMVVARHDIRAGRPPDDALDGARAVVTYFGADGSAPPWLWPWLEETVAARRGLRVLHLGSFGPLLRPAGDETIDASRLIGWLARFGLGFDETHHDGPLGIEARIDPARCAFEADPRHASTHSGPWLLAEASARARAWVVTARTGGRDHERHPVLTAEWGGVALDPWLLDRGDDLETRRWYLDPFAFFREALGLEGVPAPAPMMLNGRRVFFLHVDGDGFESLSTVRAPDPCGKVFLEHIVERYALPYTISVIVRPLTPHLRPTEATDLMLLARRVLNHPRVEPASHGVLHPFYWTRPLSEHRPPRDRVVAFDGLAGYRYSPVNEVRESIRFIDDRLMETGRRCRVMLWTGLANPPPEAVEECDRLDVLNLNGGVFRWDAATDSLAYVFPWARLLPNTMQVYAGAANENDFEGFFDTMPGSYRHIERTFENTARFGVLKPVNVYVHFYSARNPAALANIHYLIRRWALKHETAPVFASDYALAVRDALRAARIERLPDGWRFLDFGHCRSVRIDDEERSVDWDASEGLLGARRDGRYLYLHLATSNARVVLVGEPPPPRPHLEAADHAVRLRRRDANGIAVVSSSFAARSLVFAGFAPGEPLVRRIDDAPPGDVRADAEGRVEVRLEPGSETAVEVTR